MNEWTATIVCVQDKILHPWLWADWLSGSLKSIPCSLCLEIGSGTDVPPPAKLSFGSLGQRQRKIKPVIRVSRETVFSEVKFFALCL